MADKSIIPVFILSRCRRKHNCALLDPHFHNLVVVVVANFIYNLRNNSLHIINSLLISIKKLLRTKILYKLSAEGEETKTELFKYLMRYLF